MSSKYPGLNRTDIEYADFSLNLRVGCRRGCRDLDGNPYCYAKRMVEAGPWRDRANWPERFTDVCSYPERLVTLERLRGYRRRDGRRARIFLDDLADFFAPWTPQRPVSNRAVLELVAECPQHDFLVLTKSYERLAGFHAPSRNLWVGASVDRSSRLHEALVRLSQCHAAVKWLSLEPLLNDVVGRDRLYGMDWVVAGALTGPHAFDPPPEWVDNLRRAADAAGAPVFEKDSLSAVAAPLRREFPGTEAKRGADN